MFCFFFVFFGYAVYVILFRDWTRLAPLALESEDLTTGQPGKSQM